MSARILNVCVCLSSTGCFGASAEYFARQDAARLAVRPPSPMSGRLEHGQLAISGSARVEYLPAALDERAAPVPTDAGYAHRTPVFSGDLSLGYGVDRQAELFADCVAGESVRALRVHSGLDASHTHTAALWRCQLGARGAYPATETLRLLFGAVAGVESASLRRRVTETYTTFELFAPRTSTVTEYDERVGRLLGSGWATLALSIEPIPWFRGELGGALGLMSGYTRVALGRVRSNDQRGPLTTADAFDGSTAQFAAQAWASASIGNRWLRFALRVNFASGEVGATGGSLLGGEAAVVFAPQVLAVPPPRRAVSSARAASPL